MDPTWAAWFPYCMARKKYPPHALQKQKLRRPFIREWRQHRGKMTQAELVSKTEEFLGKAMDVTVLSKIENGKSPYGQRQLEAIADALQATPELLLGVDPTKQDGLWSIQEGLRKADPAKRDEILSVVEVMLKKAG
jgi:transcriptional regulator with XRE-family HTH domain